MPYIKQMVRSRFRPVVEELIQHITAGSETKYIKGEFFGYFANRLIKTFLQAIDAPNQSFNSYNFNPGKLKSLNVVTDKLASYLNKSDPIESAGDLNYILSATLWGIQGDAEGVSQAGYGLRTYLKGMLVQIRDDIKNCKYAKTGENPLIQIRRYTVVLGVLDDVIAETYRRRTAVYEDQKITENGDIWSEGRLLAGDSLFTEN